MSYPSFLAYVALIAGAGLLIYSLFPATRIIRELPQGPNMQWWRVLRLLILMFISGYLGYLALVPSQSITSNGLVSIVFLFGAWFVVSVCSLALQTVRDIKRIATLEMESLTDPLMGIYNRRYLEQRLQEEMARSKRYHRPLSVLLIDIDHFKRVNDAFGHQVGDQVLRCIGQFLRENIRESDLAARYGGEEVVILLMDTLESRAIQIAERMRQAIEAKSMCAPAGPIEELNLKCTVSIGLATLTSQITQGGQLLRLADMALYQAKQAGRNRTVVYQPGYESVFQQTHT